MGAFMVSYLLVVWLNQLTMMKLNFSFLVAVIKTSSLSIEHVCLKQKSLTFKNQNLTHYFQTTNSNKYLKKTK